MPVYEYQCQDCQETFTVTLSIKEHEAGEAKCPKCGSKNLKSLLSPFFAKTDSKSF